jgi:hypothetical protein
VKKDPKNRQIHKEHGEKQPTARTPTGKKTKRNTEHRGKDANKKSIQGEAWARKEKAPNRVGA